mgnify:CR=1 FL=1
MKNERSEVNDRLKRCFRAIFPSLAEERIEEADSANTDGWDSLSAVMLLSVVQQECGVIFDVSDIKRLSSYKKIYEELCNKA